MGVPATSALNSNSTCDTLTSPDPQLQGMVEEEVSCRCEGENSQRHLEETRLDMAMREKRERVEGKAGRESWGEGLQQTKRDPGAEPDGDQEAKRLHSQND